MKSKILFILCMLYIIPIVFSSPYLDPITYSKLNGEQNFDRADWFVDTLRVDNLTAVDTTMENATIINYNLTGDMDVYGNATFYDWLYAIYTDITFIHSAMVNTSSLFVDDIYESQSGGDIQTNDMLYINANITIPECIFDASMNCYTLENLSTTYTDDDSLYLKNGTDANFTGLNVDGILTEKLIRATADSTEIFSLISNADRSVNLALKSDSGTQIDFLTDVDGVQKSGLFAQDSSGNMVFRAYNGNMYFDSLGDEIYFRGTGYDNLLSLTGTQADFNGLDITTTSDVNVSGDINGANICDSDDNICLNETMTESLADGLYIRNDTTDHYTLDTNIITSTENQGYAKVEAGIDFDEVILETVTVETIFFGGLQPFIEVFEDVIPNPLNSVDSSTMYIYDTNTSTSHQVIENFIDGFGPNGDDVIQVSDSTGISVGDILQIKRKTGMKDLATLSVEDNLAIGTTPQSGSYLYIWSNAESSAKNGVIVYMNNIQDGGELYGFRARSTITGGKSPVSYNFYSDMQTGSTVADVYGYYLHTSTSTLNNPTGDIVGLYINNRIKGTDNESNKWAIKNVGTTTASKNLLSMDNIKNYVGSNYQSSWYNDGASMIFNPKETGEGETFFIGNANVADTSSLDAEKIENGTFIVNEPWVFGGGWYSFSDLGYAYKFSNGFGSLSQSSSDMQTPLVSGEQYYLNFTVTEAPTGTFEIMCGDTDLGTVSSSGTHFKLFRALGTGDLNFTPTSSSDRIKIDDVSLKKVTGGNLIVGDTISARSYEANGTAGVADCYDSAGGGQVCSVNGIVTSITDDPSDEKFKENLTELSLDYELIENIIPREWNWQNLTGDKDGKKAYGLVAQELQQVYPQLVENRSRKILKGYDYIPETSIKKEIIRKTVNITEDEAFEWIESDILKKVNVTKYKVDDGRVISYQIIDYEPTGKTFNQKVLKRGVWIDEDTGQLYKDSEETVEKEITSYRKVPIWETEYYLGINSLGLTVLSLATEKKYLETAKPMYYDGIETPSLEGQSFIADSYYTKSKVIDLVTNYALKFLDRDSLASKEYHKNKITITEDKTGETQDLLSMEDRTVDLEGAFANHMTCLANHKKYEDYRECMGIVEK